MTERFKTMGSKTKYVARLHGEIVGRRRSPRVYTHAVISFGRDGQRYVSWCGREDLARKSASQWNNSSGCSAVIVVAEIEQP